MVQSLESWYVEKAWSEETEQAKDETCGVNEVIKSHAVKGETHFNCRVFDYASYIHSMAFCCKSENQDRVTTILV